MRDACDRCQILKPATSWWLPHLWNPFHSFSSLTSPHSSPSPPKTRPSPSLYPICLLTGPTRPLVGLLHVPGLSPWTAGRWDEHMGDSFLCTYCVLTRPWQGKQRLRGKKGMGLTRGPHLGPGAACRPMTITAVSRGTKSSEAGTAFSSPVKGSCACVMGECLEVGRGSWVTQKGGCNVTGWGKVRVGST